MNSKFKKMLEFIYYCLIFFILINIFLIPEAFASNDITISSNVPKFAATIAKALIGVLEVVVSGYFVIMLTINGIQYFYSSARSPSEKTESKGKFSQTLFFALITFLGMYLFSKAIGL